MKISLRKVRSVLTHVVFFVALTGCSRMFFPKPVLSGVPLSEEEAQGIVKTLTERDEQLVSFRGLARTTLTEGKERATFRQAVVFFKPSDLRIEAIPTTSAVTLNLLTIHEGEIVLLDPAEKRAVRGRDTRKILREFLKFPLSEGELMSLLVGNIPGRALLPMSEPLRVYRNDATNTLTLVRGDFREYFKLRASDYALVEAQYRDKNGIELLTRLEFVPKEDGSPQEMLLSLPEEKTTMKLVWSSQTRNAALSEELFSVTIPEDYTVYDR